jgi:tRNA U34 5-carboxymethylaminomethyl modifying GTPase MnmE/TrmE
MGAIAIIQLEGDLETALVAMTGKNNWELGKMHLVNIQGVDEVIAVKLQENVAQIMLHGGMQVLREFETRCQQLGIVQVNDSHYVEAADSIESSMLGAISVATSAQAIDLLLAQPAKLRGALPSDDDLARSKRLNHLIVPPKVVLLGQPNTGKSTLMNALTSEQTSIVHHLPGATRDAVGARVNCLGLVVDVYDLPGFQESDDSVEQEAIAIAKTIHDEADLVLLIADHEHEWLLQDNTLCIHVGTKSDLGVRNDADICVCATTGDGLRELAALIHESLVPQKDVVSQKPWFFLGYKPTDE